MTRIVRESDRFSACAVTPVGIYSCKSVRDPEMEPLVRIALTTQAFLKIRSLRRDEHEPDATCLLHGKGVCFSSAELDTK